MREREREAREVSWGRKGRDERVIQSTAQHGVGNSRGSRSPLQPRRCFYPWFIHPSGKPHQAPPHGSQPRQGMERRRGSTVEMAV